MLLATKPTKGCSDRGQCADDTGALLTGLDEVGYKCVRELIMGAVTTTAFDLDNKTNHCYI